MAFRLGKPRPVLRSVNPMDRQKLSPSIRWVRQTRKAIIFLRKFYFHPASFFESNANVQNITLQANDADVGDTHSFGLVEGFGSADNAAFTISGNVLSPLVSFDRSQKDTYSIRLSVVDSTGLSFDQNFQSLYYLIHRVMKAGYLLIRIQDW